MANPLAKTKANNEPYRKVKITMWNDPNFRALSPLPPSGQSLFVYLLTGPFTGIIPGLFKAGRAALAEELGWDVEAFDLALGEALSLGMVKADTQARVFWLPNAAKHNPPTSVNVIKSWVRAFELLPECDLKYEALESLKAASHGVSKAMGLAFDKAFIVANPLAKDKAKPLPRPFQKAVNSKQILKDKTLLSHGEKNAKRPNGIIQEPDPADQKLDDTPPDDPEAGARKNRHEYPPDFETAWRAYPRRPGSPDKHGAFKAWNARLREGVTSESMLDGTRRYAAFVVATGKSGTEFIKQAKTFFGPSRHFEDEWKITTEVTQHAEFRYNPSDQRSYYEQFMEWERQTGQSTAGMAAVGTDDQNLRPTLDCEEWQSTIGPMDGPGQFDDE
ncbi:hypothetical protein [Serratia sp. PL7]|uniref:hypothetical protein n=1 Tax=Serratia sp. PL7 TaxID=2952201 RepID=UPI0021ADE71D|nr:hypothetical protein [Serratia sp. PL7]